MKILLATLLLILTSSAMSASSVYELVLKGASCERQNSKQRVDCDYIVGKDFKVSIADVGTSNAGIHFVRSSFEGDFYGSVGAVHGCVVVNRGKRAMKDSTFPDVAFISPKSGKVYKDWGDCRDGH